MIGIVLVATSIVGTYIAQRGGDALGAFNSAGVPALIFAMVLAYVFRLIFSPKLSSESQGRVRFLVRMILAAETVAAVGGMWFVLSSGAVPVEMRAMSVLGGIAQSGTLVWLMSYSRE